MKNKFSRRSFILKSALASVGTTMALNGFAKITDFPKYALPDIGIAAGKISIFSKNLQWIADYKNMAEVATSMGFDGIDLTVRPGGHVLPENVIIDLPNAVQAIRNEGLEVYMITTAIDNADHPETENILKTAQSLGIKKYRTGWLNYDKKLGIEQNLGEFKDQLTKLANLNEKYNIQGNYQNHSGLNLGGSIWDLWLVLKDINPRWLACQYDIRHATLEAANSWPLGLELLKNNIGSLDIKDFQWSKKVDKWEVENVALGQGMVDFPKYFQMLKAYQINAPFSIHYEYPLGGAENGMKQIAIPAKDVISAMKKDLETLKTWLI